MFEYLQYIIRINEYLNDDDDDDDNVNKAIHKHKK